MLKVKSGALIGTFQKPTIMPPGQMLNNYWFLKCAEKM